MAAYLIAHVTVHDAEHYRHYIAETPSIIARYGGKFIIRGGATEVLEGNPRGNRTVVIEFPSMQSIRDFYNSAEYQSLAKIRQACSDAEFICVEGVDEGAP